jgi:hypothetical protein
MTGCSLLHFQNVVMVYMVSIVSPGVTHVSTEYVTDLTEGVNMVVLKVLMEIIVICDEHL